MKENAKRQKQELRDRERRARRVKVAIGTVVAVCTCPAEESSGVQILEHRGITNAAALQGGLQEWRRRGYPTTSGSS